MDFLVCGHIKREAGSCSKRSLVSCFSAHLCWIHFSASLYAALSYRKTKFCSHCAPVSACLSLCLTGPGEGWNIGERGKSGISFLSFKVFQEHWQHFHGSSSFQVTQSPGLHQHGLLSLFLQHGLADL